MNMTVGFVPQLTGIAETLDLGGDLVAGPTRASHRYRRIE
jgi:hypothetical protein